ncbi:MAG TPA: hypothetical protein VK210_12480 [Terriglobia bacterium]|nr:hypothetical protein [Terriglobia bacterium]
MMWNCLLAACLIILVISVFNGYSIPAVFSGIALAALIKIAGIKIVARMKRK